jgi:hypothetical protein
MASIVSLKNTMVKDGILYLKDCALIWRPPLFPPSLHEPLLKILESFQVLYRLRDTSTVRSTSIPDISSRSPRLFDDTDETSSDFSVSDTLDFASLAYSSPPSAISNTPPIVLTPSPSQSRPSPFRSPALPPAPSSALSLSHSPSFSSMSSRTFLSQDLSASGTDISHFGRGSAGGSICELEGKCIIPALLPEDRPLEMKRVWNRERDRERESDSGRERGCGDVIARVFQFDFLPLGFFSRLMVQLLHLLPPVLYWQRFVAL